MYDKAGDSHYDTISAFIKSVRGSSPDGALYWLARMIESGEDPLFIARRLVILASEDIGLADPQALTVAVAAQQAVHFIGMPEGRIPLAEATVYLATAPKSNTAYAALNEAMADVRRLPNDPVPLHLRNAVTGLMHQMGYGKRLQVFPRLRRPLCAPGIPAGPTARPPLLPPRNGGRREGNRRAPAPLVETREPMINKGASDKLRKRRGYKDRWRLLWLKHRRYRSGGKRNERRLTGCWVMPGFLCWNNGWNIPGRSRQNANGP